MTTKQYLTFPVVKFRYGKKTKRHIIHADRLPHLDDNDDWWDYWFTIGTRTFQLCGDYARGRRLFRNLVVYVYDARKDIDDSMRIDEIREVSVIYEKARP